MAQAFEPPFPFACQLNTAIDSPAALPGQHVSRTHLPGYPRIPLQNKTRLLDFLEKELCSTDLDQIASKLWWMSKQDSTNISPLHRQFVKQRRVVAAEDPKLHLVWIHDRIFVKPLPRYLTSYAFWRNHLARDMDVATQAQSTRVRRSALGFLRTYFHLIQSEYDFHTAQDSALRLVPADITWEQFCSFSSYFASVADEDVSQRYGYGEIRLTRLNFYAPLLLGKSHFQRVEYQYSTYFANFYAPVLFSIGFISVVLSGLQLAVSVDQINPIGDEKLLLVVSLWFGVAMILCSSSIFGLLIVLFLYKIGKEWRFAIRDRLRLLEEGQLK